MSIEVRVPTLGESVTEATVATWFKQPGDAVAVDDMLCELETDKVSVEVPAPAAGVLTEILAAEGATVEAGGKLGVMSAGEGAAAAAAPEAAAAAPQAPAAGKDVENAPSANKMMAEKGLSPDQVQGTGRDGRIIRSVNRIFEHALRSGASQAAKARASASFSSVMSTATIRRAPAIRAP